MPTGPVPPPGRPLPGRSRRRDRRGRGLRGDLVPRGVPGHRTPAQRFDDLVLEAAERLSLRRPDEMAAVEVAVEDVPAVDPATWVDGAPLGRVVTGQDGVRLVVHRRAVVDRAEDDVAGLVYTVLVEQLASALGRAPEEIDPDLDEG